MSASSIAIIDYGMGNLHSVASAISHVSPDSDVQISSDKSIIQSADKVIFPGVGGIGDCIAEIHRLEFDKLVPDIIASGKPVLGICVGMQALLQSSEENKGIKCIGALPGRVNFFGEPLLDADGSKLKVPHMGWNNVEQLIDHPLWQSIDNHSRFYFVHSYYVEAADPSQVAGRCVYGKPFAAAMSQDNLFVTQFHPEKSHTAGLQLLKNFVNWNGKV